MNYLKWVKLFNLKTFKIIFMIKNNIFEVYIPNFSQVYQSYHNTVFNPLF